MPTARTADRTPTATADTLSAASFVRLLATPDAAGLAAAGTLATALQQAGVPFQVRATTAWDQSGRGTTTVAIGHAGESDGADVVLPGDAAPSASVAAHSIATAMGADPSPVTTLAGAVGTDVRPTVPGDGRILDEAKANDSVKRISGIGIPTSDLVTGLAGSSFVRTPFSGDSDATRSFLENLGLEATELQALDSSDGRRLASAVAIETVTGPDASSEAATRVERVLRPYLTPQGPFATLEGYADVLAVLAREHPGTGIALAMGASDVRSKALSTWRTHSQRAHRQLSDATTARYDGVFVVRVDGGGPDTTLPTVARLVHGFRSPEPVVLAVADGMGAAVGDHTPDVVTQALQTAAPDGTVHPARSGGTATFDGSAREFIRAFREAL